MPLTCPSGIFALRVTEQLTTNTWFLGNPRVSPNIREKTSIAIRKMRKTVLPGKRKEKGYCVLVATERDVTGQDSFAGLCGIDVKQIAVTLPSFRDGCRTWFNP